MVFDFVPFPFLCCSKPTDKFGRFEAVVRLLFVTTSMSGSVILYRRNPALGVVIQPVVFVCITVHAAGVSCS